ncbi:MAG: hypothetical protein QF704_15775 [Anaerolineales bacterium]|nr:hypothetical protein [Anaerolineales bacterium]MDP6772163.1 hypothetical protein [Anaerolineales bacterium]
MRLVNAFNASTSRSTIPALVKSRSTTAEVLAGVRISVGMSIDLRREVSKLALDNISIISAGISSCSTLIPLATNIGIWVDKVVLDSGFPLRLTSPAIPVFSMSGVISIISLSGKYSVVRLTRLDKADFFVSATASI